MEGPDSPPLLRPIPRRPFEHPAPSNSPPEPDYSNETPPVSGGSNPDVPRTRSILNLTKGALFGIYAPTTDCDATSAPETPWGTGAETPSRSSSIDGLTSFTLSPPPRGRGRNVIPGFSGPELDARLRKTLAAKPYPGDSERRRSIPTRAHVVHTRRPGVLHTLARLTTLFCFGVAYGALVAHLHDNRRIAPVSIDALNRTSWSYLAFWGFAGVGMGNLLPWVDGVTNGSCGTRSRLNGAEWSDVVRSIGAFVGVAFAIRKLPWETTLQLSLTLALANPFLWYLLDRTAAGLTLSTVIGFLGSAALLAINPALIPPPTSQFSYNRTDSGASNGAPSQGGQSDFFGAERIGVATWIASVLFCSCVCFGNIGRILVPDR